MGTELKAQKVGISTWLVLDEPSQATEYPSAGPTSSDISSQEIYWRCVGVYFLTARVHNPATPLVMFCNKNVKDVAPQEIANLLQSLDVICIELEINHRLPKGSVTQWGNVFYELDILKWFAQNKLWEGLIITDPDCVWRSAFAPFERRLFDTDCLIYTLEPADQKNYEGDVLINGMSTKKMQDTVVDVFERHNSTSIKHNGGEFLAVTHDFSEKNASNIDRLWSFTLANAWQVDSIKTEEHFWNIIARLNNAPERSANDIIRRMWTNFEDVNIRDEDLTLTLWHLPAEKRYGFRRMWNWFVSSETDWRDITPSVLNDVLERFMGIPKRSTKKMFLDMADKLSERLKS